MCLSSDLCGRQIVEPASMKFPISPSTMLALGVRLRDGQAAQIQRGLTSIRGSSREYS